MSAAVIIVCAIVGFAVLAWLILSHRAAPAPYLPTLAPLSYAPTTYAPMPVTYVPVAATPAATPVATPVATPAATPAAMVMMMPTEEPTLPSLTPDPSIFELSRAR